MEIADSKRSRKPVNYAVLLADSDDDFSEFTPPVKKKKDDKDKTSKLNESVNGLSSDSDKDKASSSLNSSSIQNRDKDSEKKHDRDGDKKHDRDRKHAKDRDRKHDKDKDRHKRDDKEKHDRRKERDHGSRDKERSKDRDKDKSKERDKDKSRDRDKHRETKDSSGSQDDKHKHKDKKHDKRDKEKMKPKDKEKTAGIDVYDPDFKDSVCSPKSSNSPMTSTQKSPGRTVPKSRLTVEERKFQRELEAVLAISKLETTSSTNEDKCSQPKDREVQCKEEVNSLPRPDPPNNEICKLTTADEGIVSETAVFKERENHSAKNIVTEEETLVPVAVASVTGNVMPTNTDAVDQLPIEKAGKNSTDKFKDVVNMMADNDPVPSTSTGLTHKRQRKKVYFFEESDSDSFDGFDGSELSEVSDFSPSPVKKKAKPVRPTKTPKSPKAHGKAIKSPSASESLKQPASKAKVISSLASKENTAPIVNDAASSVKSNPAAVNSATNSPATVPVKSNAATVPVKSNSATAPVKSNPATTSVKRSPVTAPRLPAASPKASKVSDSVKSTSSSTATAGASRIGLVKTPFRSPVIQTTGGSTPNYIPQSPSTIRKIGVRLGLSRSNLKPLHPSVAGK